MTNSYFVSPKSSNRAKAIYKICTCMIIQVLVWVFKKQCWLAQETSHSAHPYKTREPCRDRWLVPALLVNPSLMFMIRELSFQWFWKQHAEAYKSFISTVIYNFLQSISYFTEVKCFNALFSYTQSVISKYYRQVPLQTPVT